MNSGRRYTTCDAPGGYSCKLADESAEKAVEKVFAILGVDIHEPKQVSDFQDSLRFGDRLRKYGERGALVLISAVAVSLAAALWIGIKAKIMGGP